MKNILLLSLLFSASMSNAQHRQFLDYVVKGNDTIYGTIREIAPADYVLVRQGDQQTGKSPIIGLRGSKAIRFNDRIYLDSKNYEDPIYASSKPVDRTPVVSRKLGKFTATEPELSDFVVRQAGDTIFGKFENKGAMQLVSSTGKIAINDEVTSYRYRNDLFVRSSSSVPIMKILINDKIKLFEHTPEQRDYNRIYIDRYRSNDVVYYLQKGNEMMQISSANFPDAALQAFSDDPALVELIKNRVYGYENMYLIGKLYNSAR